jgi:putative serine protease PepD
MVSEVVARLALDADRPTYQATERTVEIRRQLTAYLGISMSEEAGRLVIGDVVPDSPADRGGLRQADVISEIMGRPIGSIDAVRSAVRARNPGDLLTVTLLRNGQSITANVILGERP